MADDSRYRKARVALNCMWPILIRLKVQLMYTRIFLFNSLVKSVFNYALPLWGIYHGSSLERLQNIFIRKLLKLNNMVPGYILRQEQDVKP